MSSCLLLYTIDTLSALHLIAVLATSIATLPPPITTTFLPRKRLQEDIDAILATGIEVHTNVEIGKDFSVEDLSKKFDAVYIAIGAHDDKKLGLDGENSKGVTSAVEMLKNIGDEKYPDFTGKKVVVLVSLYPYWSHKSYQLASFCYSTL